MKQSVKRTVVIGLAIIIYIFLMGCILWAAAPSGDFSMERLARDDAGNIYVAGNADDAILVYRLDAAGNTEKYYRCSREAQDVELLCGCYESRVYISQVWREDAAAGATQHFSIWETNGNAFRCILQGTGETDIRMTDIRVDGEGIFLAGTDLQTGEILIYRYRNDNLHVSRYESEDAPLTVCFGRTGLYVLSADSQMYLIRTDGNPQTGSVPGEAAVLATDAYGMCWQEPESRDVNYLCYDGAENYAFRDIGYIQDAAYSDEAQNIVLILKESGENGLLIADRDGAAGQYMDEIKCTPGIVAANAGMSMLSVTLAYIAVWVVFVLITRFTQKKLRLLYRSLVTMIGLSGICLVGMIVLVHFQGSGSYSGTTLVIMAFIDWLAIILITLFFLGRLWKNMDFTVAWMDKIAKGEYDIENRKVPDDEFGMIWTSLEQMCRSLRVQKYRNAEVTNYLYQYAPRNFEQLFDRENLQDIEVGETRQLSVTLGMISIIDKKTLLTGRTQKQYMQYINKLIDLLFSQRESEHAIFLQDGNNLENVKVVFKGAEESAPVAVKYSIECMEALLRRIEEQYDTAPFILLHTAVVSCGLAGGSRQVYPYVTSLEIETLNKYMNRLKDSGTRIVVTENTWQHVRDRVEGRYIGYVASSDRKDVFRLYEIMDAYPQSQKLARIRSRERFEEALELFYSNDLYLARNAFADVLKECPDDGISEWYVLACDEMFNEGDTADKRYELFGREELR